MAKKKEFEKDAAKAFEKGKGLIDNTEDNLSSDGLFGPLDDMISMFVNNLPELPMPGDLSREEKTKALFTMMLVKMGVTPEEYADSYDMFSTVMRLMDGTGKAGFSGRREQKKPSIRRESALEGAEGKTLVLKIQMKGVTKPPMWREVEVPADFNFLQLHHVIQIVTGLEDCHLWRFGLSAYDDEVEIGVEMDEKDPFSYGLDRVTDPADKTPLTVYLGKKGAKLEYVYDFGDDWIFTVEVKNIKDAKCEAPVCTKWKSDLNAMEDMGGPYNYEKLRELVNKDSKMPAKERKTLIAVFAESFDGEEGLMEFLDDSKFDLDDVNEELFMLR